MRFRRSLIWIGLSGQVLCYFAILINWQFIREWFFPLAWWSYIFLIDGAIFRLKSNSLIINRTKSFLVMLPWSVVIWLVFELFNLQLDNWYYVNLPAVIWQRYLGYILSFATVLPAIFETADFLQTVGLSHRIINIIKLRLIKPRYASLLFLSGFASIILCIILPSYFFPLVWVCFILVLEPLNYRLSGKSLLFNGEWDKILRLAAAGLICGALWEFWNWHAVSHWVYNLPYFHFWRIFEMPILGYLGFLPFAWECYLMYQFVVISGYGLDWEITAPNETKRDIPSLSLRIILIVLMTVFIASTLYLVDSYTVK